MFCPLCVCVGNVESLRLRKGITLCVCVGGRGYTEGMQKCYVVSSVCVCRGTWKVSGYVKVLRCVCV
jgi:hypothetical protein